MSDEKRDSLANVIERSPALMSTSDDQQDWFRAREIAIVILASDWLAAHDAATRADERALVLGEVESTLRAKAFEWKCEYERSDLEADYGRWDAWENAADFAARHRGGDQ